MGAIDTLVQEHREIERGLDALDDFAAQMRSGPVDDERERLARFVTFLREFADALHHSKEENILFRAMTDAGFPSDGGPLAVMLAEHAESRAIVGKLDGWARADTPWDDAARAEIATAAGAYVALLHGHIEKENTVLYPMAQGTLAGDALVEVDAAVARYEADEEAIADRARLLALLATL